MAQLKVEEKTSWAWYLLPVLFGIIGGIIGYFLLKEKDRKTAKILVWVGVIITVIEFMVGFMLGLAGY